MCGSSNVGIAECFSFEPHRSTASCGSIATMWSSRMTAAYLYVSVDFLNELLPLLFCHVNLLHVVPEVHVLEGRKLFSLRNSARQPL